jgi:hypothetical protein
MGEPAMALGELLLLAWNDVRNDVAMSTLDQLEKI